MAVSVEWFFKLKEIDSLGKMRIAHLKAKSEQENRLTKLNERRQESTTQTAKLLQDKIETNHALAEIEKKIKSSTEQRQRLMDIGGDEKKIQNYQKEITDLEEKGFECLTRLEEIDSEAMDVKTFLSGLDKTITEIKAEASVEIDKIDHELKNFDLRVDLLMEELPSDFRSNLTKVASKNLAHGPFTRIDQGSCYFCRYKISRIDESEIDMQKSLKNCPQCGRIFLPLGA